MLWGERAQILEKSQKKPCFPRLEWSALWIVTAQVSDGACAYIKKNLDAFKSFVVYAWLNKNNALPRETDGRHGHNNVPFTRYGWFLPLVFFFFISSKSSRFPDHYGFPLCSVRGLLLFSSGIHLLVWRPFKVSSLRCSYGPSVAQFRAFRFEIKSSEYPRKKVWKSTFRPVQLSQILRSLFCSGESALMYLRWGLFRWRWKTRIERCAILSRRVSQSLIETLERKTSRQRTINLDLTKFIAFLDEDKSKRKEQRLFWSVSAGLPESFFAKAADLSCRALNPLWEGCLRLHTSGAEGTKVTKRLLFPRKRSLTYVLQGEKKSRKWQESGKKRTALHLFIFS